MTRLDGRWPLTLNTAAGIVLALGVIAGGYALLGPGSLTLPQLAPAIVVIATTVAGLFACCRAADISSAFQVIGPALASQPSSEDVLDPILRAARMARGHDVSAIDQEPGDDGPDFLIEALALADDGVAPQTIRHVLEVQHNALRVRDESPVAVIGTAARCAGFGGFAAALLFALAALQSASGRSPWSVVAPALAALLLGLSAAGLMHLLAARLQHVANHAASMRERITESVLGIAEGMAPQQGVAQPGRVTAGDDVRISSTTHCVTNH